LPEEFVYASEKEDSVASPPGSYHFIGSHKIQSNDENRMLVVDEQMMRFPPLHYQMLSHLLPGKAVSEAVLGKALYNCRMGEEISNNLGRIARKIRGRLTPLGLTVERVAKQGYVLLAIPDDTD
jgi:hypothetical protein